MEPQPLVLHHGRHIPRQRAADDRLALPCTGDGTYVTSVGARAYQWGVANAARLLVHQAACGGCSGTVAIAVNYHTPDGLWCICANREAIHLEGAVDGRSGGCAAGSRERDSVVELRIPQFI